MAHVRRIRVNAAPVQDGFRGIDGCLHLDWQGRLEHLLFAVARDSKGIKTLTVFLLLILIKAVVTEIKIGMIGLGADEVAFLLDAQV